MKFVLLGSLLIYSVNLLATNHQFSCHLDSYTLDQRIFFQVHNLYSENGNRPSLNGEAYSDYEGQPNPFGYKGEEIEKHWVQLAYADFLGIQLDGLGNIVYKIDDLGCDVGNVILTKSSGFTEGLLNLTHNCSEENELKTLMNINCEITEL